jgi:hypothetical protein
MDSQTIVNKYEAKLEGQQLLFSDDDLVLRKTPFKSISEDFDKEVVIHWWMNVYVPNGYGELETPYPVYSTWSNAVYKCFNAVKTGGYCTETNQTGIEVCFYRDDPLDEQIAEVKMWLSHLKPIKKGDTTAIHLGVFEHTLSEGGVYTLWVYPENKVILEKCTYGRIHPLKEFSSLDEAFKYVAQNHWYEKSRNEKDNTYEE